MSPVDMYLHCTCILTIVDSPFQLQCHNVIAQETPHTTREVISLII